MAELREDYGSLLTDPVDEARLAGNLRRLRLRQAERSVWRARLAASAVTALVCSALALMLRGSLSQEGPLALASRAHADCVSKAGASCREAVIAFSDGSRVTRGPGARLQLVENDGRQVGSVLHDGWVRFTVEPGGPRRWRVQLGPLEIEVVGTSFTLLRQGPLVRVRVHHGRVLVRGEPVPGGSQLLTAGQSFSAGGSGVTAARSDLARLQPDVPVARTSPPDPEPTTPRPKLRRAPAAGDAGPEAAPGLRAEQALAEADRLRRLGNPVGAHAVLAGALAREQRGPHAGLLGFSLAQLSLNALQQPERAARELAEALDSGSLSRSLHEQALAQQVEALARAGRLDQARSARERYLTAYPKGRWVAAMVRWVPTQ